MRERLGFLCVAGEALGDLLCLLREGELRLRLLERDRDRDFLRVLDRDLLRERERLRVLDRLRLREEELLRRLARVLERFFLPPLRPNNPRMPWPSVDEASLSCFRKERSAEPSRPLLESSFFSFFCCFPTRRAAI